MMIKKVAIMGGSFNPLHLGHLIVASHVADSGLFDEVVFMPSGQPPHKAHDEVTATKTRVLMLKKALASDTRFSVSELEVSREGFTYTFDTISELKKTDPSTKYYLIIGSDSLLDLYKWYRSEELLDMCHFVLVNRSGFNNILIQQTLTAIQEKHPTEFIQISIPNIEISSTDIRQRIKDNRSIRYLVPEIIENYILENDLYR